MSKRFPNAAPWYEKVLFKTINKWTASRRRLPDFIIAGVQKGGTSSLYRYLEQHPGTRMPFRKQLHFFDRFYRRGLSYYQSAFPLRLFTSGKITGEATPYYIVHPRAEERLAKTLPDVKIILMFRDPIDRAYSHFQMKKDQGWEEAETFREAIRLEPGRIGPELMKMKEDPAYYSKEFRNFSYLYRGYYDEQIERWLKVFPRQQLLILGSEEFYGDPMKCLEEVYSFLGLRSFRPPKLKAFNSREYAPLDPELREELKAHFKPHNERFFELVGRRFDWD